MVDRVLQVVDRQVRVSVAGGPLVAALAASAAEPFAERAEAAEASIAAILATAGEVQGAGSVTFQPSGPNAVVRSVSQVLDDFIRISDAGAVGNGSGDDSGDIQSVIDKVRNADRPGNILGVPGKNYRITSPLVLKRGARLDLNGGTITAAYDNAPIIKVDSDAQSHSWAVRNGILIYATQQTTAHTDSACIQTSGAGVNSYMFDLSDLTLQNGNSGVRGPSATGAFTFLGAFERLLIVNNSGWAVDIDSSGTGGNTNLKLANIFSTQSGGSNTANKGFRFKACAGIRANNLNVDQAKGQALYCESVFGEIGHIAAEQGTFDVANGVQYPVQLVGCPGLWIGTFYSYASTFSATGAGDVVVVRCTDVTDASVDNIVLSSITQNASGGGAVYHAQASGDSSLTNERFSASRASDGTAITANLADFGTVKRVRRFNGVDRRVTSTLPTAADNAAALAAGLTVGMDYVTAAGDRRVVV